MPGVNYFWLVYDVSIGATPGNLMDAQITSVDVGSAQTPTATDPSGTRAITSLMSLSCGYTFAHFTPIWTSNVGQPGTSVIASGAASIDDQRWPGQTFASGFTFEYNGNVYSSFGVHSKGYIWFGATNPTGLSFTPISSTLGYEGAIAPFAFDMVAHSASTTTPQVTVRYTGTAPNRVCIIEWTAFRPWNNAGGFCPAFGSPNDWNRYDFQLHLYENGGTNANRIEFVYRDMNGFCVNANGATAQVGLRGPVNTDFLNPQGTGNTAHTASSAGTLNTNTITHGANNFFSGNGGMRFTPTFQKPLVSPSPTATNTCPDVTVDLNTTSPVTIKQWYRDNLAVFGATGSTYTADASGVHIVVVSQGGCSKISDPVTVTISAPQTWYLDADSDGYAVSTTEAICSPGAGYTNAALPLTDCDDSDAARNPGTAEICANGIDDDCDGLTDEGCGPPPTNDNRAFAINMVSYEINTCLPVTGTVSGATVSPESNSTAVTGEDVWYRFTANSPGVSIRVQTTSFNAVIELQDAAGNVIDVENVVAANGPEILNLYNPLSPLVNGQQYFIAVRNMNSAQGTGTFTICVQRIRATSCNVTENSFQTCDFFKATFVGAQSYIFDFTDLETSQLYSATSYNGYTRTQLGFVLPEHSYSVTLTAVFNLFDGAGNPDVIQVVTPNSCIITIEPHISLTMRAQDQCAQGPRPVNGMIAAHTWICGATHYEWRFRQVLPSPAPLFSSPVAGLPVNRFLNLAPLQLIPGATYEVEIRPVFPNNYLGDWSLAPSCLQIIGPASGVAENEQSAFAGVSSDEAQLVLFPNPSRNGMVNLSLTRLDAGQYTMDVFDQMGRMVHQEKLVAETNGALNRQLMLELAAGIYTVRVYGSDTDLHVKWVIQP